MSEPVTRIFRIGSSRVLEDETTAGLPVEEVQARLQRLYPELANATHRQRREGDTLFVEFLPRPGRKG